MLGYGAAQISRVLKRHSSAVCRELGRSKTAIGNRMIYSPSKAEGAEWPVAPILSRPDP